MTTTTTLTTSARRRRRSAVGHEAPSLRLAGGSALGTLHTIQDFADTTTASHRHYFSPFSGSARYSRPSFSIESGWVEGLDGKVPYVGQGAITELDNDSNEHDNNFNEHANDDGDDDDHQYDDDDMYDNNDGLNDEDDHDAANDEDYDEKLNMKNINTRVPSLSQNGADSEVRRNTFGIPINSQPLSPPISPPPARPPPCPPGQDRPSPHRPKPVDAPKQKRHAPPTTMPNAKTRSTPPRAPPQLKLQTELAQPEPPTPKLDTATEIALLQENFNLLRTVLEDLKVLCTWFFAQRPVEAFTDHVDTCGAIEENIHLILESLTRRRKLGEEEWNVRSPGWHQKYTRRMYSLNRTLFRLLAIRPTIEERVLKPHQIASVLQKLRDHQEKMVDLAEKFQASFDRLRVRHIHFLLTQAHTEASRRKHARRVDEAFERQWFEDKAIRADLRREFFAAQGQRTRQPHHQ